MQPNFVVVGLGNPGAQYDHTRHNAGFLAVETAAQVFGEGEWIEKPKLKSLIKEGTIERVPTLFVKPLTYMNDSGDAVRRIIDFYKLNPILQLLVCSDDIDIPLGTFRLRLSGGPGTHNGMKSLVAAFGEEFPRLRLGIGPKPDDTDLSAWVLSRMSETEQKELIHVLREVPELLKNRAQIIRAAKDK